MPFHDGHLASAGSSTVRRGALRSVGDFPWFDVDATQSSGSSVARRSFAPVPLFMGEPDLTRCSNEPRPRAPHPREGMRRRDDPRRLPSVTRSSSRASFAFPRAPPAGRAPHHVTRCWVGAMRPSRVVRSAGACLATRPGCPPRTLAPACAALLFPSCEGRTLRASLGRDFVNRSLQHDAAREHAYELSILSGCAAPLSECGGRARGMSPSRFARRLAPAEEPCRLSTSLARVSRCASPPYGSVSSGPWRAQKRRDEGAALVAETSSTGRDP